MASSHGAPPVFNNKVIAWIDHRLPIFSYVEKEYRHLPDAAEFQLLLELRRDRHGDAGDDDRHRHRAGDATTRRTSTMAFDSVERIMRDVTSRLADALHAHERRVVLLHRRLHPHLPRPVLRLLQGAARAAVDPGRRHPAADDGDGLHGLRAAVGPDELLGRHRHHQPVLGHPGGRRIDRDLAVGRLRGRQPDAQPLLRAALPAAVRDRRPWWCCTSWRCTCTARTTRSASIRRGRRTPCRSIPTTR